METVARLWGGDFLKLPMRYRLDYGFLRDGFLTGFAEIKCRNNNHDKYPTYMVSAEKVKAGAEWYALGIKAVLIVAFTDGIYQLPLYLEPDYYAPGGRADRNDPDDREVMAHFCNSRLKMVSDIIMTRVAA